MTKRGEGVGGGVPSPTVGRIFVCENLCMKTTFLVHLMALLGGWLCDVTYHPLLLKNYFTPIKGAEACPLVPLAMPVTVVQPRFVNGGPKGGGEATERGEGVIFQNVCLKTEFSGTLDRPTFIRGNVCSGIDLLIPYSSFFILFLINLFQGNILRFPFFLLLFYLPINGGGGHDPFVYLNYSSNRAAKICQPGQSEGAKRPSEGNVFFPPPTVGRFLSKFVYETVIFLAH